MKLFHSSNKVENKILGSEESSNSETSGFEVSSMWDIGISILYYENGVGESDNELRPVS